MTEEDFNDQLPTHATVGAFSYVTIEGPVALFRVVAGGGPWGRGVVVRDAIGEPRAVFVGPTAKLDANLFITSISEGRVCQ